MKNSDPYSGLKIFWHPEKLKSLEKGEVTAPLYARVKPTNFCNHKCYYCSYADTALNLRKTVDRRDSIPWERLKQVLNDMAGMGVKAITFSGGGEPLVYPQIADAMKLVLSRGMDLSIITNGQNLSGENAETLAKAKWARISMDSCDAGQYARIRGLPIEAFRTVSSNISNFSKIKNKDCELGINFVVNHENAGSVYEMAKYVKGLGVNHIKFTARITKDLQAYHAPFKESVVGQIRRAQKELSTGAFKIINKYECDFDFCAVFQRTYSKCYMSQVVTVIGADSKVYMCHDKAYVPGGELGDLSKKSFKEIWLSPETAKRFMTFDAKKECQHHCVYDDRNLLIAKFLAQHDQHVNFV